MESTKNMAFAPKEATRAELRSFINEGLNDVKNKIFCNFEDAFADIESRYHNETL